MLLFAVLGLILLILWRLNTKTAAMPVKGEETPPMCGLLADEEDVSSIQSPLQANQRSLSAVTGTSTSSASNNFLTSSRSAGLAVKSVESDPSQSSAEGLSEQQLLPDAVQKPSKTRAPMLSSGPEARKRLKFILGASEDYSSDEETLATKPPSGASQSSASILKSSTEQEPSVASPPSSSIIK